MMTPSSLTAASWSTDLLLTLIQKEIKARYKSSWLGYIWSVANPLAFALGIAHQEGPLSAERPGGQRGP
jgi:ABC-type polysaccharide/polyol phosphate export permease